MKSRTSFFNTTVLRKDITRFAPAWGLYLTGMLLICLTLFTEEDYYLAETVGMTIGIFSLVNFCYALVCGELLFGDLFNPKLCNALHAMPLRRESWFLTHLLSGLLFSVVPNLIVALSFMPRLGAYWYVAFVWLGGMTLVYLFFFGAAALSAMCTGNRFAMALVYGLINFLSVLCWFLLSYMYEPLLYGIEIDESPFILLSPVSYLCTNELNFVSFLEQLPGYSNPANGWPYVTGIAVIGVIMLVAALVLYRKRHLESAGDFITVRFLSPVFLALYTLTAGIALFLFSRLFSTDQDYLFLVVGIIAGFFTGSMLLQRTVRVFRPATFIGLAVTAVVLFGSLGLTRLDVAGIVRWVPGEEDVKAISIRYAYDEYAYTTADEAEIRELMAIHEDIISERNTDAPIWYNSVYLTYTLDNGKTVTRKYRMDYDDPAALRLVPWFSSPEYVLQTDDVANFIDNVNYIEVECYSDKYYGDTAIEPSALVVGADARDLIDAIIADCEAGRMIQDYNYYDSFASEPYVIGYIRIDSAGGKEAVINVWTNNISTYGWLTEHLWK